MSGAQLVLSELWKTKLAAVFLLYYYSIKRLPTMFYVTDIYQSQIVVKFRFVFSERLMSFLCTQSPCSAGKTV
jgi:hypothetical protein